MLEVSLSLQDVRAVTADLLAVGVFTDGLAGAREPGQDAAEPAGLQGPGVAEVAAALEADLEEVLRARDFGGRAGQWLALPTFGRLPASTVLFVGLGARDKLDLETLRRAAATAVRRAGGARAAAVTFAQAAGDPVAAVRAVSEAAALAAYRFERYKTGGNVEVGDPGKPRLERLDVVLADGADQTAGERAVRVGLVRARATNYARDLSNTPPNDLHPADLAAAAEQAVEGRGVRVRVWADEELREGGFGGIVGVGQGAEHSPRLVELVYEPEQPAGHVVLVGKGITFDSGGLSLKPVEGMMTMKTDMSGAAAVAAVMTTLAELDVKLKVTGYLAIAENMPSGSATRPGDVLTFRNGKTVEVLNTDAEGRLAIGDALALGAESVPDAIVDVATLTGACVVALGPKYTGMISNDDELGNEMLAAAREAGELTWALPLAEEYRKELVSEVADLKNVGSRWGGALTAGLFLKEFVDGRPWAHLDIAGPSRSDSEDGYTPKGSTGTAVRTLITWLESRGRGAAGD